MSLDEASAPTRPAAAARLPVVTFNDGIVTRRRDRVTTEEPLEIRITHAGRTRTATVTMRTPGNDFELAAGWLFSEGVIAGPGALERIAYCVDRSQEAQLYNVVNVTLSQPPLGLEGIERHFFSTSACGVCGKAGLDRLEARGVAGVTSGLRLKASLVGELPERLRAAQEVFESTGGLHAAGLFTAEGELVAAREDVGRHNALDKLIGWALLEGRLPLTDAVVVVSGRAGYELVQKCAVAGAAAMVAVGAPSSLAVDVARRFGLTLVGFARGPRFNVYSAPERIEA